MCLTDLQSMMNNSITLNNNNDGILHVIYDYEGKEDDELTLKRGSILEVLSKDENISGSEGWWIGRLLDSDSVGIFPANFVASSEPNLHIIDEKDLQIGDLIGIGGFGHVHYGKFGDLDVAVKTAKSLASFNVVSSPTPNRSHDDNTSNAVHQNLIDGLLREARLFSNLNHFNIIRLFGVSPSISTRNLYLVMEYAHGGALSYLLSRRKCGLHPHVFIYYAQQIADGMRYLHEEASEHIIHRDLKCSNILILENIDDIHDDSELLRKTLKITDFGLARKQLQSSSVSTAGTFPWMSPECIRHNEFSTKSDVWSFGVLLWECLTGEIPYKGFDQMQVAFGIATNKYSLPIPSTCPQEFAQLMTDCWQIVPADRPTFSQLYEQITKIIERNYAQMDNQEIESSNESYFSMQKDWRREIQDIFEELKTKEQEIRDREQAMLQLTIQQNHQRMHLQKWEQKLHEREMHLLEMELKLAMTSNNYQDRSHQTPKIQKRSGRFMRSLFQATLNGTANLSSTTANHVISNPTNFRHILSVSRDNDNTLHHHYNPSVQPGSSATLPNFSKSSATSMTSPTNQTLPAKLSANGYYTSNSTPTTPNLNRLRTLTFSDDLILNKTGDQEPLIFNEVHFPVCNNDSTSPTTNKPIRSSSADQNQTSSATIPRSRWKKPKPWSSSLPLKRKHQKNTRHGEPKWYLEPIPSLNTTDNTETENTTSSDSTIDPPTPKLEDSDDLSSSSCSTCSIPTDHSLARGIFDMSTILVAVGLGRHGLTQFNRSSSSSSTTTITKSIFRSTSETIHKTNFTSSSSSANTTPSPLTRKQHKRTLSSPIQNIDPPFDISQSLASRARPCYSPVRPDSLIITTIPLVPPPSSSSSSTSLSARRITDHHSDSELIDRHFTLRNRSRAITSTPEEDEPISTDDYDTFYSAQSSEISTPMIQPSHSSSHLQSTFNRAHILDIDTDEQRQHQTKILPPKINDKQTSHVSPDTLERDVLS